MTPDEAARIPPFPPRDIEVTIEKRRIVVRWEPSPLQTVHLYRIYRKNLGGKFVKIGESTKPTYVDKGQHAGATYAVTTVSSYGAESPFGFVKNDPGTHPK